MGVALVAALLPLGFRPAFAAPPAPAAPARPSPAASPTSPAPRASAEQTVARADLVALERAIDEVETLVDDALFRTAIPLGEAARAQAAALPATPAVRVRRAKLEVLIATAEVAVGWNDRACESMRNATQANPGLWLDERATSPKVVEILHDPACRAHAAKMAP